MNVARYRDYVNCSSIVTDKETGGDYSWEEDLEDENVEVGKCNFYRHGNGEIYQITYYRTDLRKMRELAKGGNNYAVEHLG